MIFLIPVDRTSLGISITTRDVSTAPEAEAEASASWEVSLSPWWLNASSELELELLPKHVEVTSPHSTWLLLPFPFPSPGDWLVNSWTLLDPFCFGEQVLGFETSDRMSSFETSFACFLFGNNGSASSSRRYWWSRFNSFVVFSFSLTPFVSTSKHTAPSSPIQPQNSIPPKQQNWSRAFKNKQHEKPKSPLNYELWTQSKIYLNLNLNLNFNVGPLYNRKNIYIS